MQKQLIAAGRLVSTSDMAMAAKLGQLVKLEAKPGQKVRRDREAGSVVFTIAGDIYELAAA